MLTGILVDVSGSMASSLQLNTNPTNEEVVRAELIFTTIIKMVESEYNSNSVQEIFVLAFGLADVTTCDLLALIEKNKKLIEKNVIGYNPLINLLAENHAPNAGDYIRNYLTKEEAGFLYEFYSENESYLEELIEDLPVACKDGAIASVARGASDFASFITFGLSRNNEKEITRDHADRAIQKAKSMIILNRLNSIKQPKTKTLKSTIDLLHEVSDPSSSSEQKIWTSTQLKNLVSSIEPFIYGDTPMCEALKSALNMFHFEGRFHNDKVLFLLTDGEATDGSPVQFARQLRDNDILVFVCLLTDKNISHPKRLYYDAQINWTKEERDMFEISSNVDNSHSAMSVFLDQGWELPTEGQSRLFIQANHPDVINDFTSLARRIMDSNDALLNIFGRVVLDQYINSAISTFKPNEQIGGTCYANAVAAVLHLAMKRIEGRERGVPDFHYICDQLINEYGKDGAYTNEVLSATCPKYRLQYKEVDELGARSAINARRPVVAIFCLYDPQWQAFGKFYKTNPKGIIESKDLFTNLPLNTLSGHAVVLIKCDPKSLTFMNSWGTDWADGGFFKVKDESVLNLEFFDVFWTLNDLKKSEMKAFEEKKRKVGDDLLRKLPASIQNLLYECPRCKESSKAKMFIGHLMKAKCPKCNQNFKPTPIGLVLDSYKN